MRAAAAAGGQCRMAVRGGISHKGRMLAVAFGLSLFIGLAVRGSPIDRGPAFGHPDVVVKAIPSYGRDIQPVLNRSCVQCHGPSGAAGLDLSSYSGIARGSRDGPVVIPGHPEQSPLLAHLHSDGNPELWQKKCPLPGAEPTPNQAKNLERWIQAGARNN